MTGLRKKLAGKVALGASAALLAVALPSAGLAFVSLSEEATPADARESLLAFTPAAADPRLAEIVAQRSGLAGMMRFTPAGAADAPTARAVTVVVRVDQRTADALSAGSSLGGTRDDVRSAELRLAPTQYNLGIARGYSTFAQAPATAASSRQSIAAPGLSRNLSSARIPDLSTFAPRTSSREEPSRFAAGVETDGARTADGVTIPGETVSDQMLDVAGSYSLTRNLNITAGVRYEQERDLIPGADLEKQDSQAVYIGTRFKF